MGLSFSAWLKIGRALLVLLLLGLSVEARAQAPLRLEETCRIAASEDIDPRQAISALGRCAQPAARSHAGTIWLSYARPVAPIEPGKTWRLAFDNHSSAGVDLWIVTRDGRMDHVPYDPAAPDRDWSSGNYLSMLFTPKGEVDKFIVRLRDAEGHSVARAPKLARARTFAPIERNQAALYGMGVGMLALTILFHLSLFFAMRRRFQLIYCGHVALLLGYALCYSSIIRLLAPGLSGTGISQALGFTMIAATATGIAFVVDFLGSMTPRWLRRWAMGSAAISALAAVALVVAPPGWSYLAYLAANIVAVHAILLTTAILLLAVARGHPMATVLVLGWSLPIGVALLYPARTFGLIGDEVIPDGLMMLAATVECLILSLPVAGRIRALRLEHERSAERHLVLERQAQTDALTGLANRRGFGDALTRAAVAHAKPFPIALLLIDIDHFKRVNDHHGHAAGDAILQHVAAHVARVAGSGAIVARHGGEEFVVALRGHDLSRAGTIAERIRISMVASFDAMPNLPRVTVSIGVAAGASDGMDVLLEDADCALYRAKSEGRNRVMLADGPLMYAAAALAAA